MSSKMLSILPWLGIISILHGPFRRAGLWQLEAWLPGFQETLWMAIGLLPANRWSVNSSSSLHRARSARFLKGMASSWNANRKRILSSWKWTRKRKNICMVAFYWVNCKIKWKFRRYCFSPLSLPPKYDFSKRLECSRYCWVSDT